MARKKKTEEEQAEGWLAAEVESEAVEGEHEEMLVDMEASEPPKAEAPKSPIPSPGSKVVYRPLLRSKASTGMVPLRTFIQSHPMKNDQLAGFNAWCLKRGFTKQTMDGWRALLSEFSSAAVGQR